MGITVMDILGAAEVQFTYRILPGVEISTKELDGMLAKLRETILRISKEEDKKEQTAIIPESIEKSEKIEDKNKLPYQDSAGENLYTGDIVFCKENYYLTICQDDCSEDDGSAYDIVLTDRDLSLTKKRPLQK